MQKPAFYEVNEHYIAGFFSHRYEYNNICNLLIENCRNRERHTQQSNYIDQTYSTIYTICKYQNFFFLEYIEPEKQVKRYFHLTETQWCESHIKQNLTLSFIIGFTYKLIPLRQETLLLNHFMHSFEVQNFKRKIITAAKGTTHNVRILRYALDTYRI